ncbi:MAG TPA: response regulator [Thermoanaerobaculia bacterium]|nr:response regulator [Thermoanaerobaculia bacterium]
MTQSNILVVEDDDSIRLLLVETLREHAHVAVDGARDGVDALHHVTSKKYDLVILDVMMPFMTGIDFLDSLQAMVSDPSVKGMAELPAVVVITGVPAEQMPSDVLEERFPTMVRRVLRKPVDVDELIRCVEAALR